MARAPGRFDEDASGTDLWRNLDEFPIHDWNVFLHELRSRRLGAMPSGARTVLSAGCAGAWYFEWFDACYPSSVHRHIGVELFSPRPHGLPENVEWVSASVDDLSAVGPGDVDLVFAGQLVEHLWPGELASFLCEVHRVLRPGGYLVADSPNRAITAALGWTQPEHTVELDHDEFSRLIEAAGFERPDVKGIWLCRDPEGGAIIPLPVEGGGAQWPWQRRIRVADQFPGDAFVWWAEAPRSERPPNREAVARMLGEIFARERPGYFRRLRHEVGTTVNLEGETFIQTVPGEEGYVLRGPSIALPPGESIAAVWIASTSSDEPLDDSAEVARIEIVCGDRIVEARPVTASDLRPEGTFARITVPYRLDRMDFGGDVRVHASGRAAVVVRSVVGVVECGTDEDAPALVWPSPRQRWHWAPESSVQRPTARSFMRALRRRTRGLRTTRRRT